MGNLRQFFTYACIGVLNTAVHFVVFDILLRAFGVDVLIASTIGYSAGVANSYILNRIFTFAMKTRANPLEFGRFAVVNVVALGLNLLVLRQLTALGMIPEAAQVFAICVSFIANFAGNKWWAFRAYG